MKHMQRIKWVLPICLAAGVGVCAAQYDATTQLTGAPNRVSSSGIALDMPGAPQPDGAFGLSSQDFWVGATQFKARDAGVDLLYDAFYFYHSTGSGTEVHDAQFQLPNGSNMSVFRCYFYDASAADASVGLWRQFYNEATNVPGNTQLASVGSSGTGGYQSAFANPSPALFVSRETSDSAITNLYTLIAYMPGSDSAVRLRGCRIFYNRQIAPAPATARFTDVPVGSQFFAETEALASSGITAGCTASQFCPTANLTRLQMAAFMARALGLHWPPF